MPARRPPTYPRQLVTIVPDSPSQWKPGFRPGLTWGFSLLPPPLSSLSLGYRDTSSEEDGVQAPGNLEPIHRALCPGSRVTLKLLLPEDGMWESPTPALGGFIRVSSWRPQDLALGLHTRVGGNRNHDQVLVRIRISELPLRLAGLGRSGAGVAWWRRQERGLVVTRVSSSSGFESCRCCCPALSGTLTVPQCRLL